MTPPSRSAIQKKYPIGFKVTGTIKHVWHFGVRVELEPGVTGLIRNKELSWEQVVSDTTQFVYQGQKLEDGQRIQVAIFRHDPRSDELILSLRHRGV